MDENNGTNKHSHEDEDLSWTASDSVSKENATELSDGDPLPLDEEATSQDQQADKPKVPIKNKLYDRINVSVRTMDIIIGVLVAALVLILVYALIDKFF